MRIGDLWEKTWFKLTSIGTALVVVGSGIAMAFSMRTMQSGHVRLPNDFGIIKDSPKGPGLYWDWGRNDVKLDIRTKTYENSYPSFSKDLQLVGLDYSFGYNLPADKAYTMFMNYRSMEEVMKRIDAETAEIIKVEVAKWKAEEIVTSRQEIATTIRAELLKVIKEKNYPVNISSMVLTNVDFSEEFEKAIEQKAKAEQELLRAQIENQQAIQKAENELEIARIEGEKKLVAAQGDAKALEELKKAEGKALANKIVTILEAYGYRMKEETDANGGTYKILDRDAYTDAQLAPIEALYAELVMYLSWNPDMIIVGNPGGIVIPTP